MNYLFPIEKEPKLKRMRLPNCHGCGKVFTDFDEPRYCYANGKYCEACIVGVRRLLRASKVPYYVEEIYLWELL